MTFEVDIVEDRLCSCGKPLKGHPKCPACGSYAGPRHLLDVLIPKDDINLCAKCIKRWGDLEKQMGHKIKYKTFVNPLELKEDKSIDKEVSIARKDGKRHDYRARG